MGVILSKVGVILANVGVRATIPYGKSSGRLMRGRNWKIQRPEIWWTSLAPGSIQVTLYIVRNHRAYFGKTITCLPVKIVSGTGTLQCKNIASLARGSSQIRFDRNPTVTRAPGEVHVKHVKHKTKGLWQSESD